MCSSDLEFAGSRLLLQEGAKAVTCGEDVLEEYAMRFSQNRLITPDFKQEKTADNVIDFPTEGQAPALSLADPGPREPEGSPAAVKVWSALEEEALTVPQITQRTGLSTKAVLGVLTELELEGQIDMLPGRQYRRARR